MYKLYTFFSYIRCVPILCAPKLFAPIFKFCTPTLCAFLLCTQYFALLHFAPHNYILEGLQARQNELILPQWFCMMHIN